VVKPFPQLSAVENVMVGGLYGGVGSTRTKEAVADAMEVLDRSVSLARQMSERVVHHRGEKVAEVARALATRPKLLLLDEFMAGLSPQGSRVRWSSSGRSGLGVTIVLVEHVDQGDHRRLRSGSGSGRGQKAGGGVCPDIVNNREVIEAYLGSRHVEG
jgi:branched-chain amino acid transport system ATP-binding protein